MAVVRAARDRLRARGVFCQKFHVFAKQRLFQTGHDDGVETYVFDSSVGRPNVPRELHVAKATAGRPFGH